MVNYGYVTILDVKRINPKYYFYRNKRNLFLQIELTNKYTSQKMWVDSTTLKMSRFHNPLMILKHGGYIGYGEYTSMSPDRCYKKWESMLTRCTDNVRSSYDNTYVTEEWLCYQNFAKWFFDINKSNYHKGYQIDKDLTQIDSKIKFYGSEYCNYLPSAINQYIKCWEYTKSKTSSSFSISFATTRINLSPVYFMLKDNIEAANILLNKHRAYLILTVAEKYLEFNLINKRIHSLLINFAKRIVDVDNIENEIKEKEKALIKNAIMIDINNELKKISEK